MATRRSSKPPLEGLDGDASPVAHRSFPHVTGLTASVCILTAAAHWSVLSAQAQSFDDQVYLTGNNLIPYPSWHSAGRAVTEVLEPAVPGYYEPLSMLSMLMDSAIGGNVD